MEGRSQDGEREEPGEQWEPGEWRGVWSAVGTWWVWLLAQKGEVNVPHFFSCWALNPTPPSAHLSSFYSCPVFPVPVVPFVSQQP